MIDLSRVDQILDECNALVAELHGFDHEDPQYEATHGNKAAREERVRTSRRLQLLADRLELGKSLVMNEYWVARGEADALEDRDA